MAARAERDKVAHIVSGLDLVQGKLRGRDYMVDVMPGATTNQTAELTSVIISLAYQSGSPTPVISVCGWSGALCLIHTLAAAILATPLSQLVYGRLVDFTAGLTSLLNVNLFLSQSLDLAFMIAVKPLAVGYSRRKDALFFATPSTGDGYCVAFALDAPMERGTAFATTEVIFSNAGLLSGKRLAALVAHNS